MKPANRSLFIATAFIAFGVFAQDAALRPWKDTQGRIIQATFVSATADSVVLRMADGKEHQIPLARLCAEDQAYAKSQAAAPAPAAPTTEAASPPAIAAASLNRVPIEKRTWPDNVVVPTNSIEIQVVEENPVARKCIYRSEAFEFTSQAKLAGSVMKEVARTFEATRALVSSLPWGVVCVPPEGFERYQAALYETRQDYKDAGGPDNSGGVYMGDEKTFKVPFESIGLKLLGKSYAKDAGYDGGTLIHEITHQVMDDYLTFLPVWVIEGTAEYTEMLPYNAGKFRADAHKTSIRDHIKEMEKRGYAADIGNLETHMTMNRATWSAIADTSNKKMGELYFRSVLIVYFFCHLDGEKGAEGRRFMKFMDAVYGETEALRTFFKDPRVKRLPEGRFSYPTNFPPPDMKPDTAPFKHLELLLDGRGYSQIAKEITEAYKNIGVKISVN
ncbi:hypothetical protein [Prosthecobacter sp.]|uniref:hypothetical protein n=1 Tax=Prosthecobacter sp. TaxID=1965333 RepID=UPI001D5A5ECA|nr:hypothetical protein [Prosthecobacter sp.]MCB1277104.1 hypothetical protein [Prosthecobacter sp.]